MIIYHPSETQPIRDRVLEAASRSIQWLLGPVRNDGREAIKVFYQLRFSEVGWHPVEKRRLNIVEQFNQTFTYLATLRATELLFDLVNGLGGVNLHLGPAKGYDIESITPQRAIAEVFAAVDPRNNDKLNKDTRRLAKEPADFRFVFFHAPKYGEGRLQQLENGDGVQVWAVDVPGMGTLG